MMSNYPSGEYRLSIPFPFNQLVVEKISNSSTTSFSLLNEVQVTLLGNDYVITESPLTGNVHAKVFNPDEISLDQFPEPFRFNDQDWIGTSDIRDTGRYTEYIYHIDECAIGLTYIDAPELLVRTKCNNSCPSNNDCFDVIKRSLPSS